MKNFFALALLSLFSTMAFANSGFEIERDGKIYSCRLSAGNPLVVADCGIKAVAGPFNKAQAAKLCARTHTLAPVQCGIKAVKGPFNADQAVQLCAGALSEAQADCGINAVRGPYTADEAIALCTGNTN